MRKLIQGIIDFRENVRPDYKDTFARLALGQSPDVLFIACSDSRVVPNLFASTNPGDVFVIRNVGNLVPPCNHCHGLAEGCESAAAALEFSLQTLNVASIIVCGHSECGAMQSLLNPKAAQSSPNLQAWLKHGQSAVEKLASMPINHLKPHNLLSQLNVLEQIKHLESYPIVQERLKAKTLQIYGWWFDIAEADVYSYHDELKEFVIINTKEANRILATLR